MEYSKKKLQRDFNLEIHKFYNNVLCNLITENNSPIKTFINQFIDEENILEKTSNRFELKRNNIINDSNKSKSKFNILVVICQQAQEKAH